MYRGTVTLFFYSRCEYSATRGCQCEFDRWLLRFSFSLFIPLLVGWTKNIFKVFLSFTVRPPKKAQDTLFKLLIENSHFKAIVRIRSALLPTLCSDQIFNREEEHSSWLQRSMLTVLQFIVFLMLLLIRFLLFPA